MAYCAEAAERGFDELAPWLLSDYDELVLRPRGVLAPAVPSEGWPSAAESAERRTAVVQAALNARGANLGRLISCARRSATIAPATRWGC